MKARSGRTPGLPAGGSALALAALVAVPAASGGPAASMVGQPAPVFRLADAVTGRTVSLEDLRGSIVVLHFATSWCPYCNAEAPHLQSLADAYADRGVQALIVNVMEAGPVAAAWAERWGLSFPVLLDPDGATTERYAPPAALPDLPRNQVPIASNVIIDREGRIRFFSLLDSANFDARLAGLSARLDEMLESES